MITPDAIRRRALGRSCGGGRAPRPTSAPGAARGLERLVFIDFNWLFWRRHDFKRHFSMVFHWFSIVFHWFSLIFTDFHSSLKVTRWPSGALESRISEDGRIKKSQGSEASMHCTSLSSCGVSSTCHKSSDDFLSAPSHASASISSSSRVGGRNQIENERKNKFKRSSKLNQKFIKIK